MYTLDQYRAAFDKLGWKYYHGWGGGKDVGPENVYAVDPTGDAMQLDSAWTHTPPGLAGDALQSICTQGNCKAANRPTPATCTAALAAQCPGLEKKPLEKKDDVCAACVYGATQYKALKAAHCLNADLVSYCVGV